MMNGALVHARGMDLNIQESEVQILQIGTNV